MEEEMNNDYQKIRKNIPSLFPVEHHKKDFMLSFLICQTRDKIRCNADDPADVKEEKIAAYKNGILSLALPKSESSRKSLRKIEVKQF